MAVKKVIRRVVRKRKRADAADGPAAAGDDADASIGRAVLGDDSDDAGGAGGGAAGAGSAVRLMLAEEMRRQRAQHRAQFEADEAEGEGSGGSESGGEAPLELTDEGLARKRAKLWADDDDDDDGARANPVAAARGAGAAGPGATPGWANVAHVTEEEQGEGEGRGGGDDDDEISDEERLTGGLYGDTTRLVDRKKALGSGTLDYQLLKDGNDAERSGAALSAVHFHPNGEILLTAAPDCKLRLFQTDGLTSTKLQTVTFDRMPLQNAQFAPTGTKIVCTAKRPEYAVVDTESSKVDVIKTLARTERNLSVFSCSPHGGGAYAFGSQTGAVHFVSPNAHQLLFSLKGDGPANGIAFPDDENQVYTIGGAKVYVWDVRTRRPLRIHADVGSMEATSLSVSTDARTYCVGSSNGVVNMYDIPQVWGDPLGDPPTPRKALMQLTTEIEFSSFNAQGEVLCFGSQKKKNAVRLAHVPSRTVFANFPRIGHYYRKLTCCAFSPSSGLLCLGNDRGRALMFRLQYYGSA